uniref:Oligosaccharyltransferase complex subunit ostc n=1 Tax=Tanacetum cinerariifolium TaxID=118510 RepID=A0A6L2LDA1_TANCI|nr:oligosaccharyltransferase complex subunit ostc [Tanacetum cinerariifolium]
MDPLYQTLSIVPFSILKPPRLRLKIPNIPLPSPTTVLSLLLLTYFIVISGVIYDVIVEPPGIGSTQDPRTGTVKPVVFMSGRVNGQYIIEGLSSGFMFLLGGAGIIFLDLAMSGKGAKNVKTSFAVGGVVMVVIGYVMSMLFLRIKIPGYLR